MTLSGFASSPDAAQSSRAPSFLVQVFNEVDGTTRFLERSAAPISASSERCVLFRVNPVQQSALRAGYDDFDLLSSEVAADAETSASVARGREWVASTFGSGDLASLRLAAGLSQSELAALCGIEQPHISRYESGRHEPLVGTACKMASALGVSIDVFANAWSSTREMSDRSQQ